MDVFILVLTVNILVEAEVKFREELLDLQRMDLVEETIMANLVLVVQIT